jgi:hypothetical protein
MDDAFLLERPAARRDIEYGRIRIEPSLPSPVYREIGLTAATGNPTLTALPAYSLPQDMTLQMPTVNPDAEVVDFCLPIRRFDDTPPRWEPLAPVSLPVELLRPDDLDYGKIRGIFFKEPSNRQSVRGFIGIPAVWGIQLRPPDELKRSVINLAEAMNRYTDIRAVVDPHLTLESRRLMRTPFILITTDQLFELTPLERRNFGFYFRNGGFAVIDNCEPQYRYSQSEASLRKMLRDSLGSHARFHPIPSSHPLYHCFFDFRDGPPLGSEIRSYYIRESWLSVVPANYVMLAEPAAFYLEGIWVDGRLVAIYSDMGYSRRWHALSNNEPQLKMGVNFMVYAMEREGGIARQDSDRYTANR